VIVETANRLLLTAVNDAGEQAGLSPGMTLSDARAICPSLATFPACPRSDHLLLRSLARWCTRFSPLIAFDPPDGLVLETTGCERLFGSEQAILDGLIGGLSDLGFAARAAGAASAAAAQAFARFATNASSIPAPLTRDRLGALPVQALRLEPHVVASLMRLGLERIGDLYPLKGAALQRRFGAHTLKRLRQALGAEGEAIRFLRPRPHYAATLTFAEPIATPEQIAHATTRLLEQLCARLAARATGCRRLELTFARVDGADQTATIGTARAVNDPSHLSRLIADRLGGIDPGFGIERARAEALITEPVRPSPRGLLERSGQENANAATDALIDRLANRLGFDRVTVFAPADSHIPERAYQVRAVGFGEEAVAWPAVPARPLRLLSRPEPLAAFSFESFRHEGAERRIARAAGPERIEPEWWWDDPEWRTGARDYWQIETEDGRRFWVYRTDGLEEGSPPRWYLHGLFV